MSISEILDKLIGHTDVWCETNYDNKSLDNLEKLEEVACWLVERINDNLEYNSRIEYSAKAIVSRTKRIITDSGLDMLERKLLDLGSESE